jgi:hypothetical protein
MDVSREPNGVISTHLLLNKRVGRGYCYHRPFRLSQVIRALRSQSAQVPGFWLQRISKTLLGTHAAVCALVPLKVCNPSCC